MLQSAVEHQVILVQLGIWDYLSDDEINKLYNCETDNQVERLSLSYQNKYWDKMMEDYEKKDKIETDICEEVEKAKIPKRVKCILLRNRIKTSDDFLDVMMEKGWDSIRGLGISSAKIVLHWIFPENDIQVTYEYVKKYRYAPKEGEI